MTEEINEIIKKNLPAQVGEVLKERLAKAEKDAETVRRQLEELLSKAATIRGLESTIEEYKKLDARNAVLDKREIDIAEKERNQKVFEAELKLAEAEKRITDNTNFVGMVFKSPIYRATVNEYQGGMQNWNNTLGRNEFVPDGNKSKTETKEMD